MTDPDSAPTPESLSREELDALLSAVHGGAVDVSPPSRAEAAADAVPYNFRRPSRVSKEQIRGLMLLHEDFTKLAAGSLSGMLRTMVDVELESVEQIAFREYLLTIPTPSCAFVFNMAPLKGGAVLELHPSLAFLVIDKLLGGQGQAIPAPRDFTEIERAVIDRIALRAMVDLQQAWQQVDAFVLRVLNLETNPQFIQVTAPNEVILVATYRLKILDTVGRLTLAYPYLLLEPIIERLGGQRWAPTNAGGPTADCRAFVMRELAQSHLTVRAFLGEAQLAVRDVLALRRGQVVPLTARPGRPVRLHLNGVPKYDGRLGTHQTHLAVEILRQLGEGETGS